MAARWVVETEVGLVACSAVGLVAEKEAVTAEHLEAGSVVGSAAGPAVDSAAGWVGGLAACPGPIQCSAARRQLMPSRAFLYLASCPHAPRDSEPSSLALSSWTC